MKIIFKFLMVSVLIICTSYIDKEEAQLQIIEKNLVEAQTNLDAVSNTLKNDNK